MADHLDSPGLQPPGGDASIDITDVYAFRKSATEHKSILMMNVNPLAPSLASTFNPNAIYEIKIDTDGDALAEVAFKIKFSGVSGTSQSATVRLASGAGAVGRDFVGSVLFANSPVSFGSTPAVSTSGDFKFFAGLRSDPFFFDLLGFLNGLKFTGADFFVDKNVFGIVLEVPNSALGGDRLIGVWARTLLPQPDGSFLQIDRMGRPAINTVFMHGKEKRMFNQAEPIQDRARFTDEVVEVLEGFGYSATEASGIAQILLPDILAYDTSSTAGFLNGRGLQDDVIDIELSLVTKNAVTSDQVGPHADYLSSFPYLGTPH